MKKSIYGIVFFTSIILTACAQSRNSQQGYYDESSNSITYQQFYDDLSPYGQWLNDPELGYVWRPGESGFRPYYSNGNWEYTNYGWTWVSNYNWGWAPFHYGRWFYDRFEGWMWVPGYDWAPAWVSWRGNSQYYGWAPLCPQQRNGRNFQIENDQWSFVPQQYITKTNINNYYINQQNNNTIINNTTVINNNTTVLDKSHVVRNIPQRQAGPNVTEVERATNAKITPLQVVQSTTPGAPQVERGRLQLFKPAVNSALSVKSRPGKIVDPGNTPANNVQPANDPKVINSDPRKVGLPEDRIIKRPSVRDNSVPPASVNDARPSTNIPATTSPATNNPAANSNERPLNLPAQRNRQIADPQSTPVNSVRPAPAEIRPIDPNKQIRQLPEVNRANQDKINNAQPDRTPVAPRQNVPANDNRERRIINNQDRNPTFNQRPAREQQAPQFNRPTPNFEKQTQSIPNTTAQPQQGSSHGKRIN